MISEWVVPLKAIEDDTATDINEQVIVFDALFWSAELTRVVLDSLDGTEKSL